MKDIEFTAELLKRQEKIFWALKDLQMEFVFNGDIDLFSKARSKTTDFQSVSFKQIFDKICLRWEIWTIKILAM